MDSIVEENKRKSPRHRVYKRVKCSYNNEFSSSSGLMRNLSDTGALLKFTDPTLVPKYFRLHDELDGYSVDCEIVRYLGDSAAVRFVGPFLPTKATRKQTVSPTYTADAPEETEDEPEQKYSVLPAKFGKRRRA